MLALLLRGARRPPSHKKEAGTHGRPLNNPGAGDGSRTRNIQLGRLALYQLSYSRPLRSNVTVFSPIRPALFNRRLFADGIVGFVDVGERPRLRSSCSDECFAPISLVIAICKSGSINRHAVFSDGEVSPVRDHSAAVRSDVVSQRASRMQRFAPRRRVDDIRIAPKRTDVDERPSGVSDDPIIDEPAEDGMMPAVRTAVGRVSTQRLNGEWFGNRLSPRAAGRHKKNQRAYAEGLTDHVALF
jgi:hypothetical protein